MPKCVTKACNGSPVGLGRSSAPAFGTLVAAALAGAAGAALPRLLAHAPLARGALQEVLPGWAPPPGLVQAAFASRQGMRPAVRQLLDALAAGFDALVREGRCLRVTAA